MIQTGSPLQTGKNAKYMQLADWIAERIHSGEFAPGKRLPSNRKLAGQWNLSAITITAAMDELVRRRLIVRRRGSGTFVTSDPLALNHRFRIGFFVAYNTASTYLIQMLNSLWTLSREFRCDLLPIYRAPEEIEEAAAEYALDGALIFNCNEIPAGLVKRLRSKGTPALLLSSVQQESSEFSIGYSNERIIEDAVAYLTGLGHRNLGFLVGHFQSLPYRERYNSFMAAMWKRQLPVNLAWINVSAIRQKEIDAYFSQEELPTALIVGDRLIAHKVCRSLLEHGIRVPDELSVFCIDDPDRPELLNPPLSRFRIDVPGFCRAGMLTLLQQVNHGPEFHSDERNYEFVEAGSCAPPPQR
ncbi:substrate-binding domain-containing protein [Victivallis sp.]|uniref:substrate-binding domain-containing protein n=1 Tax=Victivallis sp. TaxID=2049020 RepID=UPI003A9219CE